MILYIFLDGNNIKLSIKLGRKIIAEHAWQGEYSLSEQLLPKINELLRKNKIPKEKVEGLRVGDVLRLFTERFLTGKMPEELRGSRSNG